MSRSGPAGRLARVRVSARARVRVIGVRVIGVRARVRVRVGVRVGVRLKVTRAAAFVEELVQQPAATWSGLVFGFGLGLALG